MLALAMLICDAAMYVLPCIYATAGCRLHATTFARVQHVFCLYCTNPTNRMVIVIEGFTRRISGWESVLPVVMGSTTHKFELVPLRFWRAPEPETSEFLYLRSLQVQAVVRPVIVIYPAAASAGSIFFFVVSDLPR